MKQTKKGFTLVELLVVIAILAILATVSVVGYTSFIQKAHESNDVQLLQSLNTLIIACDDIETPHDAFEFVRTEGGVDLAKFHSKIEGCEILWDSHNQMFCYLNSEGELVYVPGSAPAEAAAKHELWFIADERTDIDNRYFYGECSVYYVGEYEAETFYLTNRGFDTGNVEDLNVEYTGDVANEVLIRTNGGNLTITSGNVAHYGNGYILTKADGVQYTEHGNFAGNSADVENVGVGAEGWTYVHNADELATALANNEAKIALGGNITITDTKENGISNITDATNFTITANTEINLNGYNISVTHYYPVGYNGPASHHIRVFLVNNCNVVFSGMGTISLLTTGNNLYWNSCSAVVEVRSDAQVTFKTGVKIVHLGGTAMAFAVDMVESYGNQKVIVDGAMIKSTYVAVRVYTNNEQYRTLQLVSGTIDGASEDGDIWKHVQNSIDAFGIVEIADSYTYTTSEDGHGGTSYYFD